MDIPKTRKSDWTRVLRYPKIPWRRLWMPAALIPVATGLIILAVIDWTAPPVEPGSHDATAYLVRDGGAGPGADAQG